MGRGRCWSWKWSDDAHCFYHGDFDDMSAQEACDMSGVDSFEREVLNTWIVPTGWPTSWRSGAERLTTTLPE